MGLNGINNLFGLHERSLLVRGERTAVLAANLANADTPGYKARDVDFSSILAAQPGASAPLAMATTSSGHIATTPDSVLGAELKYRVPFQNSLDGNTVEAHVEQAAFAENAVRYQASLMFINRRVQSLETALSAP